MTAPHRTPRGRRQPTLPQFPDPRPADKDLSGAKEPGGPPMPDDPRPLDSPEYVVVIAQRRGADPSWPPSLAEILETGHARISDPEPDLEAEP